MTSCRAGASPAVKFVRQPTRLPYNKRKMRTFGAFSAKGGKTFYGELIGDDEVSVLERPFWLSIEPTGEKIRRQDVEIRVPVSPSKLIAVGLNYAEHIAEMKRTPLGDFKIQRALNLDGGSSSAFWFRKNDGSAFSIAEEKTVRDFVGIVAR